MTRPLPYAEAAAVLRGARTVFLTVHQRPDGDALGSQLALSAVCRRLGSRTYCYNEDPLPGKFRFLPGSRRILASPGRLPARFDVAVVMECAHLGRAGAGGAVAKRARRIINIDHHLKNRNYGAVNLVDTTAAANIMLVEKLRAELGVPLTLDLAVNLYVGLYTETGGFRYTNTTPEILRLASELVELGVSPKQVGEHLYEREPLRRLKLLSRSLESLSVRERMSWMAVTLEDFRSTGAREEDAEDFVDYPRSVSNVDVAAFLREVRRGEIRVSLRAKADVPVNKIAEEFDGGGHAYAAGCTIKGLSVDAARLKLAAAIRRHSRSRRRR